MMMSKRQRQAKRIESIIQDALRRRAAARTKREYQEYDEHVQQLRRKLQEYKGTAA